MPKPKKAAPAPAAVAADLIATANVAPAGRRRYKLADYAARRWAEAAVEFETPDGSVFVIPPPELWPAFDITADAETQLRSVLGDAEYDRFIAAGGNAVQANMLYAEIQGGDTGEGDASTSS